MTGEDERLADGPITVVISILVAGYLGSIAPQFQPIAGMIQASAQENREQFGDVHRRFDELGPDHYDKTKSIFSVVRERDSVVSHPMPSYDGKDALN